MSRRDHPLVQQKVYILSIRAFLCRRHNHRVCDNAHHKAGLFEIVDIRIFDTVLRGHVLYEAEPRIFPVRIFALYPLEATIARRTLPELWSSLNEVGRPHPPDALGATVFHQAVRQIFTSLILGGIGWNLGRVCTQQPSPLLASSVLQTWACYRAETACLPDAWSTLNEEHCRWLLPAGGLGKGLVWSLKGKVCIIIF